MKTKIVSLLLLTPFLIPGLAAAQPSGSGVSGVVPVPQGSEGLNFGRFLRIINQLIDYFFTLLLVLAVVFILWAAFKYLTAGGDEEKVGKAHQMLLWAVIAIAVALLAQGVIYLVGSIVGVDPFEQV